MTFRLELGAENGKPRYWEVLCDHCEVVGHFTFKQFPDFPAAFERAVSLGWGVTETARGVRYSCPECARGLAPQGEVCDVCG